MKYVYQEFDKFLENKLCSGLFFNKVTCAKPATLLKMDFTFTGIFQRTLPKIHIMFLIFKYL